MDYMINDMLIEFETEENPQEQVVKAYIERFKKEKEDGDHAE